MEPGGQYYAVDTRFTAQDTPHILGCSAANARAAAIDPIHHRYPAMRIRCIIALSLTLAVAGCVRSDLAPGVNPNAIKAIQLGMSMEDVIGTLGMPLSVGALRLVHQGMCPGLSRPLDCAVSNEVEIRAFLDSSFNAPPCCEARRCEQEEGRFVLKYSRMVDDNGVSPMLWVHFNGFGQVREVYARLNSHTFRDDVLIYMHGTGVPHVCKEDLLQRNFSQ